MVDVTISFALPMLYQVSFGELKDTPRTQYSSPSPIIFSSFTAIQERDSSLSIVRERDPAQTVQVAHINNRTEVGIKRKTKG